MKQLLKLSRLIDATTERIAGGAMWLIPGAALLATGNAVAGMFGHGTNALTETQYHLFAAVVMLCGANVLRQRGHVQIDLLSRLFSRKTTAVMEIVGMLLILAPVVLFMTDMSMPQAIEKFISGEGSGNADGIPLRTLYMTVPLGFALLGVQGISEIIKLVGFLKGECEDPATPAKTDEEALIDELQKAGGAK